MAATTTAVVNAKLFTSNNAASSNNAPRGFLTGARLVGTKLAISSTGSRRRNAPVPIVRAAIGENPTWEPDDFIVLGLGHCFTQDERGKLQDLFVIEPIGAAALECMENGGKTCYKYAASMPLGTALKQDLSLLPPELQTGQFCDDFDFRTRCASRSWMREYPQQSIVKLIPLGTVRSDFNFSLDDKRILNQVRVVTDADNIKQDMSIDVYGRKKDQEDAADTKKGDAKKDDVQEEFSSQVSSLYNV